MKILATTDTVVLPGIYSGPALSKGRLPAELAEVLVALARRRAPLVSIRTSAFVLAATGLLDGRSATTDWLHAERFRTLFPRGALNPDVLFVDNGDVLTSAGNAAGVDLCLHLVGRDRGAEVAARCARRGVVAPFRDGGQSQFIERPLPEVTDTGTGPTREWALGRLGEPLTLAELAGHARMSVRTFTRRFPAETGQSPAHAISAETTSSSGTIPERSPRGERVQRNVMFFGLGAG